jgi:hypothetical protein
MRKRAFGNDTCLPKSTSKLFYDTFFVARIPLGPPLLASNLAAVEFQGGKDGGRN